MKENKLNIYCNSMAKLRKFWHVWHPYPRHLAHTHPPSPQVKNHCYYRRMLNMQTVKSEL